MNRALLASGALTLTCGVLGLGIEVSSSAEAQERSAQLRVVPPSVRALQAIEFETLAASVASSGGDVVVQPMAGFGPGWGGGAQLFWRPPAPVDQPIRNYPHLSMLFDVPETGEYELTLQYTRAPDYGRFTVLVAGSKMADVDGYGPVVEVARVSLGRRRLTAGANQITFTVFAKASSSTGFVVGLDRLEAARVDAAGPAPTARRSESATRVAMPRAKAAGPTLAMPVGEGASAVGIDPVRAMHLMGEDHRPRLEARTQSVAGRRGLQTSYEPRRVRLDWDRRDLRIGFRWLDPAGAPGAVWRIYSELPPPAGKGQPIASGPLPATAGGAWQDFERDLGSFKPQDPFELLRNLPVGGSYDPGKLQPRLFVEVQPTDAAGAPIGQASNFVELKFTSEPMGKLKRPSPAVSIALVDFKPVKPYEERFLCWAVATKDGPPAGTFDPNNPKRPMWTKGSKRSDLCDRDDSGGILGFVSDFASAFGDALMAFVDSMGSVLDQVSAVYGEVKGGIIDLVAAPLSAIGCGAPCESALELALDAALTSVGVPPSLPDFDQLMQTIEEGKIDAITDALVETAVSQGLPVDQIPLARDAARAAVERLMSEAERAAVSRSGGGGGDWAPDLSRAYSPAVFVFEARNWGTVRSHAMNLRLIHKESAKTDFELVPAALLAPAQTVTLGGYEPAWLQVPALEPGTSTRVAVTLMPEADPHLWLDLIYGRSSLLPPQEWCDRDYGANNPTTNDPKKYAACKARMDKRFDLMYSKPDALNRAWGEAYGKDPDSFELTLFRFGDFGNTEGSEANLTCDYTGHCVVQYADPTWLGRRIDLCLGAGKPCGGEPVAQEFCKRLGYPVAMGAQGQYDLGAAGPTVRLADGSFCAEPGCDGLSNISCSNRVVGAVVKP